MTSNKFWYFTKASKKYEVCKMGQELMQYFDSDLLGWWNYFVKFRKTNFLTRQQILLWLSEHKITEVHKSSACDYFVIQKLKKFKNG